MASASGPWLLDRGAELGRLGDVLDGAWSGAGALVVVAGPAGIGKTWLLEAAHAAARQREMAVLTAAGGELEREFPFALVRQLLGPALGAPGAVASPELTAGAAALAAPLLGQPAPGRPGPGGPSEGVLHGLYWLVANLAQHRPTLLSVDDTHWADAASIRFFSYLGRRLEGLRVVLLLGVRDTEPDAPPPLGALVHDPSACLLRPAALSTAAVFALVRARLSPLAEEEFARACHTATGGNPFFVGELLAELAAQGLTGRAAEAPRVAEAGPRSVSEAVVVRLSRHPPPATAVAQAVAVLGANAQFRHVARLAGLDDDTAAGAIASLAPAGILEDVRPLRFVHPVVRTAIYATLGPTPRSQLHRRAAELLGGEGAAPVHVAAHLAATDPRGDAEAVAVLRAAAAEALAHSAPESAVSFLRRAVHEPPSPEALPAVVGELGTAEALAHDPRALSDLAQAVALTSDPAARGRLASALANLLTLGGDVPAAVAVLDDAIRGLGPEQRELALALENDLIHVGRLHAETAPDAVTRTNRLRAEMEAAAPATLTGAQRLTLVNVAVEMTRAGESAEGAAAVAERALDGGRLLGEVALEQPPFAASVLVLLYADRFEAAAQMLHLGVADARRRGSPLAFAAMSTSFALLEYRRGNVGEAESHLAAVDALEGAPPFFDAWIVMLRVALLLERGEVGAAADTLDRHRLTGEVPDIYPFNALVEMRGRLRLAEGAARPALEDLLVAGRRQLSVGETNPAVLAWRSSAALAHVALGEREAAGALAEEEVALARAFGARRAVGVALRAAGLVAGGAEGIDRLGQAVSALEGSGACLELARALTDLGSALRRAGRRVDARDPLRRGLDLALACGASALVERARTELAATGARPRRLVLSGLDALTPSEHRVATMAASGMTNAQIAQALFVSARTIEMHLSAAYRKLAITSRDELAGVLEGAPRSEAASS